jgi:hypothetical protein
MLELAIGQVGLVLSKAPKPAPQRLEHSARVRARKV